MPRLTLAAALLAAAPAAAPAAEPEKLLPAATEYVVSVNVKQLLGSAVVKEYALGQIKDALQGQDAQKMLADLGLDPLKDVERVTVGLSGSDGADLKFLAVVRGTFDPDKMAAAAQKQAKADPDRFKLLKDGGGKVFQYTPDSGTPYYATVVDAGAVVIGSDKKTVADAPAAARAALTADLAALVGKMDDTAAVWATGVVKDKLGAVPLPGGLGNDPRIKKLLANIDAISVVVRATADVTTDITLGMKTPEAAAEGGKGIAELLQALKGLLPLLAGGQPELKPLVKEAQSLTSKVDAKNVVISGKMTGAAIGKLLNPGQ